MHLEEDAGKSLHEGFPDSDRCTYLDFNRSGVPLIEIVTEPDLRSAADAATSSAGCARSSSPSASTTATWRRAACAATPTSRCAAPAAETFGVKAEVKNLNSFRHVQRALEYEIERQTGAARARAARVVQETRLWDAAAGRTVSMRSKEEAHDYRYFPEPDLPPLQLEPAWIEEIRAHAAGAAGRPPPPLRRRSTRCPSTTPAC